MSNKEKWYLSTWFIIISMICFWPVGLVLLTLRVVGIKKNYKSITNFMFVTGIILLILFVLFAFSSIGDADYMDLFIGLSVIFLLPGSLLFIFGLKRRKKLKIYEQYLDYINFKNKISITTLCNKLGTTSDVITKTLREMISQGIIDGYINESDYFILKDTSTVYSSTENRYDSKDEIVVVKCQECGATNKVIVGKSTECEYCGTILTASK